MWATLLFQAVDLECVAQTQIYADFSCLCLLYSWPSKFCQYVFVPLSQHPSASRTCPHNTSSLWLSNGLASRIKDKTYSSLLISIFSSDWLPFQAVVFMKVVFYIYELPL